MENQTIGLNILEQAPTNKDITITFNPDPNYQSYKLIIKKDNEIYKEITKINLTPTEFTLSETGIYQIEINYYDMYMNEQKETSGTYTIDKEAPVINIKKRHYEIFLDEKLEIKEKIIATDNIDKSVKLTSNISELELTKKGTQKLIYTAVDQAGNTTSKEIIIHINNSSKSILVLQTIFIIILSIIALSIYIYKQSAKLERKISKFSISPLNDTSLSLFDSLGQKLSEMIKKINTVLYKSEFIKKYSKRYTKYIKTSNRIITNSMDLISIKILCGILCIIIAVFAKTIQFKIFNIYDVYLPLLLGFFLPDLIYYFKYRTYKTKLENDLLQAIIIMNNAFKSGRSIIQAIELVSKELEGPMAEEFKKMHLEISFGLEIDIVFKRLYDRLQIEEIAYLTASLAILNQTGGNIVKVFDSIEKSLFNKKKLRLELKSLTSGSKMIVRVLIIVPILFIMLIWIINPTFFLPLLSNKIGYIIIGITLIYYILYIICIRKLLKVKL